MIFAGMVIIVFPDSPARLFAEENETEMHLLGVKHEYRGKGLGKILMSAAIEEAKSGLFQNAFMHTNNNVCCA